MKTNKNFCIILISSLFLFSCSNTVEGFKLKKKSTAGEEFLIEKKDPLILPPEFSKLPKPNEQLDEIEEQDINLETVFEDDGSKKDNNTKNQNVADTGIKESILKKIQK